MFRTWGFRITLLGGLVFGLQHNGWTQESPTPTETGSAVMETPAPVDENQMLFEKAIATHDGGDPAQAVDLYKEVIKRNKTHAGAYANMGLAYMQTGKIDDAIKAYEKALEYGTDDEDAGYNLGTLYCEKRKYKDAIRAFEGARQKTADAGDAALFLNLGNAHLNAKSDEAALTAYQSAMRIDPDAPEPYYNLGILYARQKNLDQVVASLQGYLERAGDAPDAAQVRDWIVRLSGDAPTGN
jgi:tetratricopeptide (TPR) repeat protein